MPKISDAARAQRTFNATVTAEKMKRDVAFATLDAVLADINDTYDADQVHGVRESVSVVRTKAATAYSAAVSAAALAMVDAGE